jgi:hypothetical protein
MTCDFVIWSQETPVVSINGSPEFALWLEGVPLADVGAGLGGAFVPDAVFRDLEVFNFPAHFDGLACGQMDDLRLETGGYGVATPWRVSSAIRRTVKLPLAVRGLGEIGKLRRFFDRHRGRQSPFWLPSWVDDYKLLDDAAQGGTTITIEPNGFSEKHALGAQYRFIALLTRVGKLECYGVTAAVENDDSETLTLSRGLDSDLTANETICCPLLLVRPTEDVLEYDYIAGDAVTGVIDCLECPREYPEADESSSGTATAHFGTRPVFLYRITDGTTTLLLADYGADVVAAALTWLAADISGADWTSAVDMLGDTLRVTVKTDDLDHPLLGYLDPLQCRNFELELFVADLDDLGSIDLSAPEHAGRVEQVEFSEQGAIILEVSSLFRLGEQRVPRIQLQRLANESVYKYAPEGAFTTAGVISGLSSIPAFVEATAFGAKATAEGDPNWFALGKVVAGDETRMCTGQSGNRLYLNYPFRRAVVGNAASAVAGDDKRAATWASKFGELNNFLGWQYIPAKNPQFKALETPKPTGGKK